MRTLSKSDFKAARTCATKLYYRELDYPDNANNNPYLTMLAEGGYMVEQLARLLFPGGIELDYGQDAEGNWRETAAHLQRDEVTLFEATLLSGRKLARVDILRKHGNEFELIEVKSKSFKGDDLGDGPAGPLRWKKMRRGTYPIRAEWVPYLEDVAYQVHLLRELFPGAVIRPRLLVVDKSRTTVIDGYPALFDIRRDVVVNGRLRDLEVRFTGDPGAIDPGEFLRSIDVTPEIDELLPAIVADADRLVALLGEVDGAPIKATAELGWKCRDCEFRVAFTESPNGYRECWGKLGDSTPHIFDLYKLGANQWNGERLGDVLIQNGMTSIYDIDPGHLSNKDGKDPSSKFRQLIQIEHTRDATVWIGRQLRPALDALDWPLHFIDFETSQLAVPYHARMTPYGRVAFQWSCHTIVAPGTAPTHTGWLNTEALWPNAEFVQTLRTAIGDSGRVLTWSQYERTILREVRMQLEKYDADDPDLIAWLDVLIGPDDGPSRLFDLHELCVAQFFHPRMQGRTSIKVVLDALWHDDAAMRERYRAWGGEPSVTTTDVGPYEGLPPVIVGSSALNVADGTDAMRAYQAMLYGAERHDPLAVATLRSLLDRYCKLDTLAMVLVWDSWRRQTDPRA